MTELTLLISDAIGSPIDEFDAHPIGGGCINDAQRVDTDHGTFFVKLNASSFLESFRNEAAALKEIASTQTIKVPKPICADAVDGKSCLVLEFIEEGSPLEGSWEAMGQLLASLHRIEQAHFGWSRDNVIGSTPQPNPKSDDWFAFYRDHRLAHQFALCGERGYRFSNSDTLLDSVSKFFDRPPQPSLLHGDLWSGNASFDADGSPFLYDPCSYYGDREADLAFTEFFGGFDQSFYHAYRDAFPLNDGYATRKHLYNLYHCLNHAYLFGGSYVSQAQSIIDRLLSEIH